MQAKDGVRLHTSLTPLTGFQGYARHRKAAGKSPLFYVQHLYHLKLRSHFAENGQDRLYGSILGDSGILHVNHALEEQPLHSA